MRKSFGNEPSNCSDPIHVFRYYSDGELEPNFVKLGDTEPIYSTVERTRFYLIPQARRHGRGSGRGGVASRWYLAKQHA